MKYLIFAFIMFSCKPTKDIPIYNLEPTKTITVYKTDTIKVDNGYIQKYDSLLIVKNKEVDSLKIANNKLGKKLLHSELVITNAKYYLNIANKNPSQQKFLRGWMNRALNQ